VLKEGVVEDPTNRERIARLLRFASTLDDAAEPKVSLEAYAGRMKEGQNAIYFVTAESHATAKASPHLEVFRARGVEVLLLSDPVDEWVVTHLTEFDGKPLKSVTAGKLELPGDEPAAEDAEASDSPLVERLTKALDGKTAAVRKSARLTDSPACLVGDDAFGMSANLQRMLRAAGQEVPVEKRVLEVNLAHPLLQRLDAEADEDRFAQLALVLFEQAVLAEGGRLEDPAGFVQRVNRLLVDAAA